jgi:hypothetical protein
MVWRRCRQGLFIEHHKYEVKEQPKAMSARIQAKARRRRKTTTYLWIAALSLTVIGLIYYEQTEVLYILATLGVTALLIVVAVSDIHGADKSESASAGDLSPRSGKVRSTFGSTSSSNN